MVVSLDFSKKMNDLFAEDPLASRYVRSPGCALEALQDCRIITIGADCAFRTCFVSVADHTKQRIWFCDSVDFPGGIEDFMSAVLRVHLCKHKQLHVCG